MAVPLVVLSPAQLDAMSRLLETSGFLRVPVLEQDDRQDVRVVVDGEPLVVEVDGHVRALTSR